MSDKEEREAGVGEEDRWEPFKRALETAAHLWRRVQGL